MISKFYSGVLGALGTEALLNDLLNGGELRKCFAAAPWAFAVRQGRIDPDRQLAREFGYRHVFVKPKDWVTTVGAYSDAALTVQIEHFNDSPEYIYSDEPVIYARWISDAVPWTPEFESYVHMYFAWKVASAFRPAAFQPKLVPIAASAAKVSIQVPKQRQGGSVRGDGGGTSRLIG